MSERAVLFTPGRAPTVRRSRIRQSPPCPCCGTPGGFCEPHRKLLARVRDELGGKGWYHDRTAARGYRPPKCCNPSCVSSRPRGEQFCAECVQDGWTKDLA